MIARLLAIVSGTTVTVNSFERAVTLALAIHLALTLNLCLPTWLTESDPAKNFLWVRSMDWIKEGAVGVPPLKETGRISYYSVQPEEAVNALKES